MISIGCFLLLFVCFGVLYLLAFALDRVVSRTVSQLVGCDLVTVFSWCKIMLKA